MPKIVIKINRITNLANLDLSTFFSKILDIYEQHMFTTKAPFFKSKGFLAEVKELLTEQINLHVREEEKLAVFDQGSVYLPTKKIGKNNPLAEEIRADGTQKRTGKASQDTERGAEASKAFLPRQGRTLRQQTATPPLLAVHT